MFVGQEDGEVEVIPPNSTDHDEDITKFIDLNAPRISMTLHDRKAPLNK